MIGFVPFAVLTKPALKNNKITVGFSPDGFYVMSENCIFLQNVGIYPQDNCIFL